MAAISRRRRRFVIATGDHPCRTCFLAAERLTRGAFTRGQLRWNYEAILPGVYTRKKTTPPLRTRVFAAWPWSGRNGVIAGRAAAALHGAAWMDPQTPVVLIGNESWTPTGLIGRNELVRRRGWLDLHVVAEHSRRFITQRVGAVTR